MTGSSHFLSPNGQGSSDQEIQDFAKILRSLEQFARIVKGQDNFWKQNTFLTCLSWRFLISNELEKLEFKLEMIIGI